LVFPLADSILRSILVGSLYALIGIGITQTFVVTKIANFAHGELVTIGAYVAAAMTAVVGFALSVPIAFVASAMVVLGTDELVFKPLVRRRAKTVVLMVASLAVAIAIRYSLYLVVVPLGYLTVTTRVSIVTVYSIFGGNVTNLFLWVVPTTIISVALLELLFHRTKTGRAMRAVAENVSLARVSGINVNYVRRVAWIIGGGIAGVAGSFWATYAQTTPELGWSLLLRGFAATTIGGFSSFSGTIIGGYVIGFTENLGMDALNTYVGLDPAFKPALTFAIMVAFLLFRPSGITLESAAFRKFLTSVGKRLHLV
jgi:branched-subunit amino acid ABC-type transport system permease component